MMNNIVLLKVCKDVLNLNFEFSLPLYLVSKWDQERNRETLVQQEFYKNGNMKTII